MVTEDGEMPQACVQGILGCENDQSVRELTSYS